MIKQKTTLVLGAGASAPYGLPIARDLREMILRPREDLDRIAFEKHGKRAGAEKFRDAFRGCKVKSIDAFLADRADFREAGKFLLAANLMLRENPGELLTPSTKFGGDWLATLFELMDMDATVSTFAQNALSIVTFNYDRSFEYALYLHVLHKYGLGEDEARDLALKIPVYHLYSSLGTLRELALPSSIKAEEGEAVRPYEPQIDYDALFRVAPRLRIVHDELEESSEYKAGLKAVATAARVLFLGFGFHPYNVNRIVSRGRAPKSRWRATCCGMTPDQRAVVARSIPQSVDAAKTGMRGPWNEDQFSILWGDPTHDTDQFLRENADFLTDR